MQIRPGRDVPEVINGRPVGDKEALRLFHNYPSMTGTNLTLI